MSDALLGFEGNPTNTNVSSTTTSTTILAANPKRKGAIVSNDSTAKLYLDLTGGTASSTAFSICLVAGGNLILPQGTWITKGTITGIWASANGSAGVCEIV